MKVTAIRTDVFKKMRHAIGYEPGSVKRGKYKAYRNHYIAPPCGDREWDNLVSDGYATKCPSELLSGVEYQVTRTGLNFMEGVLGIKIEVID